MVATQGIASASLQRPYSWAGAASFWYKAEIEGGLSTAPDKFDMFFYRKPCLVSSSDCCQLGGCGSTALNDGFEYVVAKIPAHAGGDPFSLPHFSSRHPVIVCDVHHCQIEDDGQVLVVVAMALKSMMNYRVHYLPDGSPILNITLICGYVNIAWNEIYMEISEFGSPPIGYAVRRNYFN
jgi:hypothetical protein